MSWQCFAYATSEYGAQVLREEKFLIVTPSQRLIGLSSCCRTSLHVITTLSASESLKFCTLSDLWDLAWWILMSLLEEHDRSHTTSEPPIEIVGPVRNLVLSDQCRMKICPRLPCFEITWVVLPADFEFSNNHWTTVIHYPLDRELILPFTLPMWVFRPAFKSTVQMRTGEFALLSSFFGGSRGYRVLFPHVEWQCLFRAQVHVGVYPDPRDIELTLELSLWIPSWEPESTTSTPSAYPRRCNNSDQD